jgi:hypothetical protein
MASQLPNLLATPSLLYREDFDKSSNALFSEESSVQFVQLPFNNQGWCWGPRRIQKNAQPRQH